MNRSLLILVLVVAAGTAYGLQPQQVLVVANAASQDSVEVAQTYVTLRDIPEENLLLVKTTTKADISAADFDTQIRQPILNYLLDYGLEDKIRCIVLIYGMPVRVMPVKQLPPEAQEIYELYSQRADEAALRLALVRKLARTVGEEFPQPRTEQLTPLEDLFPETTAPRKVPTDKQFSSLLAETLELLATKQAGLAQISDGADRRIAERQLMALYLEVGGVQGLANFIEIAKPANGPDLDAQKEQLDKLEKELLEARRQPLSPESAAQELDVAKRMLGLVQVYSLAGARASNLSPESSDASVDSELALVLWDGRYNVGGWMPNMLNWRHGRAETQRMPKTMMTCRIDGPSPDVALGIIRASLSAQKHGLAGVAYIDGGSQVEYDEHLRELFRVLREAGVSAKFDAKPTVFGPNACENAALYVGGSSPRRYIASCNWVVGAVGWHIGSYEAAGLRDARSMDWCPQMLSGGVAATVGAVNEPYLAAFPLPDEFFPLLLTGKWTVAECYWATVSGTSWRLTLIADPLYNPYREDPQIDAKDLPERMRAGMRNVEYQMAKD